MGPLSDAVDINMVLEQRRKNMKAANEEIRKSRLEEAKFRSKDGRDDDLHKIKLAKELAKTEQVDGLNIGKYLKSLVGAKTAPLAAPTNPEAGPSDKVPAMLTPGEAVIPKPAAQDPRNKPIIQEMINQGRAANVAPLGSGSADQARTAIQQHQQRTREADPAFNGYADGTAKVVSGPLAVSPGSVKGYAAGTDYAAGDAWLDEIIKRQGVEEHADLIRSVYQQESSAGRADTSQPNSSGARGPMQVLKGTFQDMKDRGYIPKEYQWDNPKHSAEAGVAYLKHGLKQYGSPEKAAAFYFSGPKVFDKTGNIIRTRAQGDGKTVGQYVDEVTGRIQPRQVVPTAVAVDPRQASAYDPRKPVASQATVDAINAKYADVDAMVAPPPIVQDDIESVTGIRTPGQPRGDEQPPVAGVDIPKPITVKPEFPERGTPADAATVPPPLPNGTMPANFTGDPARVSAFDAAMASDATRNQLDVIQKESKNVPEDEKESWLAGALGKLFGETGLFSERELLKFGVLAAGGLLTGGSVGGSIRYAGIAAMNSAEHRYNTNQTVKAAQQAEAVKHIRNRQEKLSDKYETRINQLENLYFTGLSKSTDAMKAKATDLFIEAGQTKDPAEKERKLQQALHYLAAEQAPTGSPKLDYYVNRYDGLPYETSVHGDTLKVRRVGSQEWVDPKSHGMDMISNEDWQKSRSEAIKSAEARILPVLQRLNSKGGKKVDSTIDEKAEAARIAQEASSLRYTLGRNMNDDDFAVVVENAMQGIAESGIKVSSVNGDAFRKYAQGEAVIAGRKGSQMYTVKDSDGKAKRPSPEAVAEFDAKMEQQLTRVYKEKPFPPAEKNMRKNSVIEVAEAKYNALNPTEKKKWEASASGVQGYSPFLLWVARGGSM